MSTYAQPRDPEEERRKAEEAFGINDQSPDEILSGLEDRDGVSKPDSDLGDKTKYELSSDMYSKEQLKYLAEEIGAENRVTTIESAGPGDDHSLIVY